MKEFSFLHWCMSGFTLTRIDFERNDSD